MDADVYQLVTEIVRECPPVVLLKTLILDEFESVRNYAFTHFTSESTVRRDLMKVGDYSRYKIEISVMIFSYWEKNIRFVCSWLSFGVFIVLSWPFSYIDEQLIEDYVEKY